MIFHNVSSFNFVLIIFSIYFRLEKLQKLAEKVHQEAKVTDSKLDDIEAWIEEEAKRVDHLHPKGRKNYFELLFLIFPAGF